MSRPSNLTWSLNRYNFKQGCGLEEILKIFYMKLSSNLDLRPSICYKLKEIIICYSSSHNYATGSLYENNELQNAQQYIFLNLVKNLARFGSNKWGEIVIQTHVNPLINTTRWARVRRNRGSIPVLADVARKIIFFSRSSQRNAKIRSMAKLLQIV